MSHRKHSSTAETGLDKTMVAPGVYTGVYYIIITGLRKDTKWSDVKDFLRDLDIDGSLDHVQIHPGTTTGWVRVFGNPGFHAAMERFWSAGSGHTQIMADGRQEFQFTEITNLDIKPPDDRPPHLGESGVFASQLPSLPANDGGSSGFLPQNVSMSYTNPVVASSGGGAYAAQSAYGQPESGYYQTHPTQYDNSHRARVAELYGPSSGALVDDMASLAFGDFNPTKFTPADFKIAVKYHGRDVITKDMVKQFVQGVAPGAMSFVARIDILMGRGKHRGPAKRALIVFINAEWCTYTRGNMFGRDQEDIRIVQQADDDNDPEEEAAAAAGPSAAAPGTGEQPIPTGPRLDPRTRKEKKHDYRLMEMPQHRRRRRRGNAATAAAGEPSSSGGPGGGSSSGNAAPGAPGGWSASGGAQPATSKRSAGGKVKAKDTEQKAVVVDGTSQPQQRHPGRKHGEKKRHE